MFDVFISYAHEDEALASTLASGLGRIGKPWWRRRSLRVFRDANVMTASADLWDAIRRPLEESRWFVAVISPSAAASPWVSREMSWWMDHREHDHLLVVLADGTGTWDDEANDWAIDATAVPAPLRSAFVVAPTLIDATWARETDHLDRRDGRVLNLLAEIAAPVQGTTKDAVVGEELRQRRRTVRTAFGAAALLLVLTIAAVIGALVALDQRDQAEQPPSRVALARPGRASHRRGETASRSRHPPRGGSVASLPHQRRRAGAGHRGQAGGSDSRV